MLSDEEEREHDFIRRSNAVYLMEIGSDLASEQIAAFSATILLHHEGLAVGHGGPKGATSALPDLVDLCPCIGAGFPDAENVGPIPGTTGAAVRSRPFPSPRSGRHAVPPTQISKEASCA
jgi:hypothetical protein